MKKPPIARFGGFFFVGRKHFANRPGSGHQIAVYPILHLGRTVENRRVQCYLLPVSSGRSGGIGEELTGNHSGSHRMSPGPSRRGLSERTARDSIHREPGHALGMPVQSESVNADQYRGDQRQGMPSPQDKRADLINRLAQQTGDVKCHNGGKSRSESSRRTCGR